MPQIDHNAPRFKYQVSYKLDDQQSEWNTVEIDDWRQNKYVVFSQPTFRRYLIKVEAHNENGESNIAPNVVIGYSGEDVPLESPTGFCEENVVTPIDHRTAFFKWNSVNPNSLRGHFKGYKFKIWSRKLGEANTREVIVTKTATEAVVDKLFPFDENVVTLRVFNGMYDGPPSTECRIITPEGPPGPVDDLRATPLGSSAFLLTWKKPKQTNGILLGYKIYYQVIIVNP